MCEIQGQDKIGEVNAVDRVRAPLDSVAHLIPMEDLAVALFGMRSFDKEIHFRIGDQLQSLVRERHAPVFLELLCNLREHKAEGNSPMVSFMKSQKISVGGVGTEIEDGVATQVGQVLGVRF